MPFLSLLGVHLPVPVPVVTSNGSDRADLDTTTSADGTTVYATTVPSAATAAQADGSLVHGQGGTSDSSSMGVATASCGPLGSCNLHANVSPHVQPDKWHASHAGDLHDYYLHELSKGTDHLLDRAMQRARHMQERTRRRRGKRTSADQRKAQGSGHEDAAHQRADAPHPGSHDVGGDDTGTGTGNRSSLSTGDLILALKHPWSNARLAPMAANVQWFLYDCGPEPGEGEGEEQEEEEEQEQEEQEEEGRRMSSQRVCQWLQVTLVPLARSATWAKLS